MRLVSDNQLNEATTAATYRPGVLRVGDNTDPDFILQLHTCAQRPSADGKGGTTDSFFCDPEYDKLYAQQLAEFDEAKRVEIVKQMQARFYDQVPVVILATRTRWRPTGPISSRRSRRSPRRWRDHGAARRAGATTAPPRRAAGAAVKAPRAGTSNTGLVSASVGGAWSWSSPACWCSPACVAAAPPTNGSNTT